MEWRVKHKYKEGEYKIKLKFLWYPVKYTRNRKAWLTWRWVLQQKTHNWFMMGDENLYIASWDSLYFLDKTNRENLKRVFSSLYYEYNGDMKGYLEDYPNDREPLRCFNIV